MKATINKERKFKYATDGQYPGLPAGDLRFFVLDVADGTAKIAKTNMTEITLDSTLLVNTGLEISVDGSIIGAGDTNIITAATAGEFSGFATGDFIKLVIDSVEQAEFNKVIGVGAGGDTLTLEKAVNVAGSATTVGIVHPENTGDYDGAFTIDTTGDYMLYVESITTGSFDPVEQVIVVAADEVDVYNEIQVVKSQLSSISAAQGVTPGRILS